MKELQVWRGMKELKKQLLAWCGMKLRIKERAISMVWDETKNFIDIAFSMVWDET